MPRLDGQIVAITGAAGGIGSLVAAGLRAAGGSVLGIDRMECPNCDDHIVANLADADELAVLATTLGEYPVDLLVNIAGVQYFGGIGHQTPASIALGYAVNLVAPATLIGAVLPSMIRQRSGQIVNIGSVMGAINFPYFSTYSSAKAGLRGLSEAVRREVHGYGISVTHIAPRAVRTAFNAGAVDRFMAAVGMRADDPTEVAKLIVAAVLARRREVLIGIPERVFVRLNAIAPRMIDVGLAHQTLKARAVLAL